MKIASVVGTRPQFIKAAMVNRGIKHHNKNKRTPKLIEILINTGQHYDYDMSQTFFDQLKIPQAKYNLTVGSASHGKMTGTILIKIEKVLIEERPDWVVVYGDTNTTLAAAIAAAKIHIPIAHVESGLRSFNRFMPEEINRILTDTISALNFCPSDTAATNLRNMGISRHVYQVGDVMYDAYLEFKSIATQRRDILAKYMLKPRNYCLATVHRQENTDNASRLQNIFSAFKELAKKDCRLIVPLHPRTRKALQKSRVLNNKGQYVSIVSPVDYIDMIALVANARALFTDSGGMQKEAFFARTPCITLRDETEWIETVESGWNRLAGADTQSIIQAFYKLKDITPSDPPKCYGLGNARHLIIEKLISESPFNYMNW